MLDVISRIKTGKNSRGRRILTGQELSHIASIFAETEMLGLVS